MSYLQNAAVFLVQTVAFFLIAVFLARVLLIAVGASFYDPICRFVYTLTNPVITPIRRYVPRWRKVELASLLIAWLLVFIELVLFVVLGNGIFSPLMLFAMSFVELGDWLVGIEIVLLVVRCVLSFIVNIHYNSVAQLVTQLTEPVVRPFRRLAPNIAGMDFSLWFASIALILVRMLVLVPLADLALSLRTP